MDSRTLHVCICILFFIAFNTESQLFFLNQGGPIFHEYPD